MYNVELKQNGETQTLNGVSQEDVRAWLKLISPEIVSPVDFDKLSSGQTSTFNKSLTITAVPEEETQTQQDTQPKASSAETNTATATAEKKK
jgi:hypothetical protein